MRPLFFLLCCFLAAALSAQGRTYAINFDNGTSGSIPPVGTGDGSSFSDFDGQFGQVILQEVTSPVFAQAQPDGLVMMIDGFSSGPVHLLNLEMNGAIFHGEITSGQVEIKLDLLPEGGSNQGAVQLLFTHGDGSVFSVLQIYPADGPYAFSFLNFDPASGDFTGETDHIVLDSWMWYRLRLILDLDENTISLNADDVIVGPVGTLGRAGGAGFQTAAIFCDNVFTGRLCLDNVTIDVPTDAGSTLPVAWEEAQAEWAEDCREKNISWQTSAEQGASAYQLQRSANGGRWADVGPRLTPANGAYAVTDRERTPGDLLYRVRQTDLDGTVHYSPVFGPSAAPDCEHTKPALSPNPVTDRLVVDRTTEQVVTYRVVDAGGREVLVGQLVGQQDRIDVSGLPAGLYYLRTEADAVQFVKR